MRGAKSMGRTYARVKVQNNFDVELAEHGMKSPGEVRGIEVDALVDTGATTLCLPMDMIGRLGLTRIGTRKFKTATGRSEIGVYGPARITIQGRDCRVDVFELSGEVQPLIGYVPLEWLDLQVDPKGERLVPNPEHGEEMILDLL